MTSTPPSTTVSRTQVMPMSSSCSWTASRSSAFFFFFFLSFGKEESENVNKGDEPLSLSRARNV